MTSSIVVHDLSFQVFLGCSQIERSQTQEVRVTLQLWPYEVPQGARTDNVADTYDYAIWVEKIQSLCAHRSYHLIEHLAQTIFDSLKANFQSQDRLLVKIHKVQPPIPQMKGGATFILGDPE